MKRLLAISLLSLYLVTGTELRQLFKIPVLVQHYQEHKADNNDLNFVAFLYMHYAGDDMNDKDQDRDMQLPFKSCDGPSVLGLEFVPPLPHVLPGSSPVMKSKTTVLHPFHFSPGYLSSIWQPPRVTCA